MPVSPVLLATALGGGLLWALSRKKKGEVAVPERAAVETMLEHRNLDGLELQYFKPSVRDAIMRMMSNSTPVPAQTPPGMGPTVAAFGIIASNAPAEVNAQAAITQAVANGLTVLGTLSLPIPQQVGRFIVIGTPDTREHATVGSAYAVLFDPAGEKTPPLVPPAGGGGGPGPVPLPEPSEVLPPDLQAKVDGLLNNPDADPFDLEDAADALAESGFPQAAARLRARAKELRTQTRLDSIERGGTPFTIRQGDIPFKLAEYYTGDANRWREIPDANKGMTIQNINGETQLVPWHGTILLPVSWEIWNKRLPHTLHASPQPRTPGKAQSESDATTLMDVLGKALGFGPKKKIPTV